MRVKAKVEQAMSLAAALAAAWLAVAGGAWPAQAQGGADFYRGKTIELDVGTGVGGGYDANARLVARHLGRFIPGNPTIIVNNLPGGGGIRAANTLFNKSSRDGLVLGTFSNAMITEPLLGAGQAMFAPDKFVWIGSASREDGVCIAARSAGVTAWADLLRTELLVGTTAPGTTTYMYPVMLRTMFGAKFKLVSGYPDGGQIALALQRGEVQSVCQTYSSLGSRHRGLAAEQLRRSDHCARAQPHPGSAGGAIRIGARRERGGCGGAQGGAGADARGTAVLRAAGDPAGAGAGAAQRVHRHGRRTAISRRRAPSGLVYRPGARGRDRNAGGNRIYALPAGVIAKTKAIVSETSGR